MIDYFSLLQSHEKREEEKRKIFRTYLYDRKERKKDEEHLFTHVIIWGNICSHM